ncbi:tRNA threonylcarbamoyladenosine biosynthesis protein TsaB [Algoriphagus iocasae]|uniref:tRNA threonylcarbamoyladenosine biosynthesis protein TsaB n=1 Tax=Algoriphagus iocasae TaxID=1836499 RepID=A0A841MGC4_9BACT|nr:tRNA (adenosine(37)-N6)-threonylcarbamoyltransferase complex dimerization subunit type 1 TsaB [Algoriphagus iocasae]MBB6325873.1 tRNA threonylcarbamoyladenosine biosynthesis protein TsaB [Algoriphagus iocasae]
MALILSIETSTPVCSVALHDNGELLRVKEIDLPGAHSERLIGLIQELLEEKSLDGKDISAVAVSEGPGSYTGLRIGVSTAKGLCFAWGIPLIGVSTLAALARGAKSKLNSSSIVVSMLDARRMEVYREIYDSNFNPISSLDSEVIDESSFDSYLQKTEVIFIGDAVPKAKEVIINENAVFLEDRISAIQVGELAWIKYQKNEFENLAYFVPNYLKEFKVLKSKKNPLLMS